MSDLISRADAIEALCHNCAYYTDAQCKTDSGYWCESGAMIREYIPSADAVHGYTEWLEDIIVKAETLEWLCEDTPCKEWCDENCHYSSIQAECLRHLYEVSKGGDDE